MADTLLYISLFSIWTMLFYHIFLMQGGFLLSLNNLSIGESWINDIPPQPMVSILIPAHNEELVIEETIKSMINLNYPKDKLEIIIINDHSTDLTGMIAESYASRYLYIKVVNTIPPFVGKGKSTALNEGLKHSIGEIIVVYDADNTPEPDAVRNLILVLQKDSGAGVSVGKFRVINADKNLLTRLINIETITFQWLAQAGRWYWFKLCTIPGTNFAIRRSILEELGGWDENALSEDTELSIRVYNLGYYIRFFPLAVTWEQEPELWRVWWKQRTRWACGNLYVITKYILGFHKLQHKKVFIDLLYFMLTYFLFIGGILISHGILITSLFVDLNLTIGLVSYVLLVLGFLLFVTEALLAISIENNQLTFKNFFTVLLMYFTYSQIWLLLVMNAVYLEIKSMILRREITWYKTQRFQKVGKDKEHSA
ncbi:glycosyltransferase family 2 protein [Natronincola ferrireducens]|uniref:Glycosyltransferase, catalytic subunit of cellulose synthase and poly-beta-1,6-N-acetylglucosamine synthase n=1 Tax=Natronincola ferrireducens TaxID=393762 RepID=A0A1G8X7M8_9FIRM|nr:glycosyltransferase [Natronincola ferrireducens]SDJ86668.1 Glycosyltransferase, catalytic subunit of cellulose synthase and poly-beta-1,6-N-acetylglucosamine synthase [Natronincola ferrireducens]